MKKFALFFLLVAVTLLIVACGEEPKKAHVHTWDEGTVTTTPTCAKTGEMTYTCTGCGKTKTEELAKTNDHNWVATTVQKPATCEATGVQNNECTICHSIHQTRIDKLEHNMVDGVCSMCGMSEIYNISDDGVLTLKSTFTPNGALRIPASVNKIEVTAIGERAFQGCDKLDSVSFPKTVKKIGANAFLNCTKLGEIKFTEDSELEEIGNSAFQGTALVGVGLPAALKTIGGKAFYQCTSIEGVGFEIGSKLDEIKQNAFFGCTNLDRVELPESLTKIGNAAFRNCPNLTEIELPSTLKTIEGPDDPFGFSADVTPRSEAYFTFNGTLAQYKGIAGRDFIKCTDIQCDDGIYKAPTT